MFAQADFVDTSAGPRLTTASSWLEVTLEESREVGWSLLVTSRVDAVSVGDDDVPLVHRRGRFLPPP
jgi:flavin reductase (DIM6/NTAB) family NADH-FMN oxidoreductase RutF